MLNLDSSKIKFIGALLSMALLTLSSKVLAYDVNFSTTGNSITVSTSDSVVKTISLSVLNPNGETVFSKVVNGKSLVWALASKSIDGRYKYEATLSNIIAGSRSRGETSALVPEVSKHSGSAYVQSGQFVLPREESEEQSSLILKGVNYVASSVLNFIVPPAHADVVHLDDTIINGSLCAGQDCVNGESFGFDTIRTKENNVRMNFDDTSNSSSFPSNDWRFLFNESSNGGASMFSVEDATAGRRIFTLDAGAPENSLYVDASGKVGFGTSTPSTTLEMASGNSPTMRLNQDASFGFNAQAWDLVGNEQGFFVRDVTGGSSLPMSIASGAPTNALVVDSSGKIGLGISNPTETLHVMGNAIISGNLELGSSRAIKNQIKDLGLEQAMNAFKALEPVMFKYNHSPNKQSIGFIAEDVPDLVATESRKSLMPMDIVAVLTKVVQEQQKAIDQLSEKLDVLLAEKK